MLRPQMGQETDAAPHAGGHTVEQEAFGAREADGEEHRDTLGRHLEDIPHKHPSASHSSGGITQVWLCQLDLGLSRPASVIGSGQVCRL